MRHIQTTTGQLPDNPLHKSDSPRHTRRTTYGRIGHAAALCLALIITSCGVTERISTEKTVDVNERQVAVPVPGHVRSVSISAADLPQSAADTLTIQDNRVRLTVQKSADDKSPLPVLSWPRVSFPGEGSTAEPGGVSIPSGEGTDTGSRQPSGEGIRGVFDLLEDNYLFTLELLPDTIQTTVTDTTITERKETVRTETKTGWLAWMTIGGLLAIVIILLVAFRIRT